MARRLRPLLVDDLGNEIGDPLTLRHWTQRDGSSIPIECMDDQHIDLTIKMLCRNIEKAEQQGRTLGLPMARAWVERLTFEAAERALGNRRWKRNLGRPPKKRSIGYLVSYCRR